MSPKSLILTIIITLFAWMLTAQATYDGNIVFSETNNTTSHTEVNYVVPAGDNSALVVFVQSTNAIQTLSVTYGGTPLVNLGALLSAYEWSMWYLAQGSLAAPLTGDIVVTANGMPFSIGIYAASFKNVNQATPVADFMEKVMDADQTSILSFPTTTTNDLVFDFIASRNTAPITMTTGPDQTSLSLQSHVINSNTETCNVSLAPGNGGSVDMEWNTSGDFQEIPNGSRHIGGVIQGVDQAAVVPTLSQWGVIVLGLLMLIIGVAFARQINLLRKDGGLPAEISS